MVKVTTNFQGARAKLQNIRKGVTSSLPEVLESEGRIAAISLAKSTQPFGTGTDAKDMGERAVIRDVAKVYASLGSVFSKLPTLGEGDAAQFWKLIKLGRFEAAMDIIRKTNSPFGGIRIGPFDGGSLHAQARNQRTGRVSQKNPSLIVSESGQLSDYMKKKMELVGFAKSAWASVARQLGGIRGLRAPKLPGGDRDITANWITRKSAPGTVERRYGDAKRPTLTLRSQVRYADNVLSRTQITNAIRIARDRIVKQLQIAARYEAQKAKAA